MSRRFTPPFVLALPLAVTLMAGAVPSAEAQGAKAPPAPVAMLCEMTEAEPSGWVPEIVLITRQANGRIEVFDPILQALLGRPIQAQIVEDTRQTRTYGWALAGVRNGANQWAERMDFRLTLHKADSTATMVVTPKGYDNVLTGAGLCGRPNIEIIPQR